MKNNFNTNKSDNSNVFWSLSAREQLKATINLIQGLSNAEANRRIKRYGANRLNNRKETDDTQLYIAQFKNSIILIILVAIGLSFFFNEVARSSKPLLLSRLVKYLVFKT